MAAFSATTLCAAPSVTETVYGLNAGGGIDFNDPLYSLTLGGNLDLADRTATLFSSGNASLGAWQLPGASSYGAELSGNVSAPEAGWYTFDLSLNGNDVALTSRPGEGSDSQTETTVYLPGGDSSFDFQYGYANGKTTSARFYVQGDDPIQTNGDPAPDTSELVCLFPGVLCAAHALRRRFAGK